MKGLGSKYCVAGLSIKSCKVTSGMQYWPLHLNHILAFSVGDVHVERSAFVWKLLKSEMSVLVNLMARSESGKAI